MLEIKNDTGGTKKVPPKWWYTLLGGGGVGRQGKWDLARGVRLEVVRCGGERLQGILGSGRGVGEGCRVVA